MIKFKLWATIRVPISLGSPLRLSILIRMQRVGQKTIHIPLQIEKVKKLVYLVEKVIKWVKIATILMDWTVLINPLQIFSYQMLSIFHRVRTILSQ